MVLIIRKLNLTNFARPHLARLIKPRYSNSVDLQNNFLSQQQKKKLLRIHCTTYLKSNEKKNISHLHSSIFTGYWTLQRQEPRNLLQMQGYLINLHFRSSIFHQLIKDRQHTPSPKNRQPQILSNQTPQKKNKPTQESRPQPWTPTQGNIISHRPVDNIDSFCTSFSHESTCISLTLTSSLYAAWTRGVVNVRRSTL